MKERITILCLADLHGDTAGLSAFKEEAEKADIILMAGDLTSFGGAEQAERILSTIGRSAAKMLAVRGNCDLPGTEEVLERRGICLESRTATEFGIDFLGVGGGLELRGLTPFERSEEEIEACLDRAYVGSGAARGKPNPLILLVHEPPFDTTVDKALGLRHVGSRAIRCFIDYRRPMLTVCGHIHESRGIDSLGDGLIVNPGSAKDGFFARATLTGPRTDKMNAAVDLDELR